MIEARGDETAPSSSRVSAEARGQNFGSRPDAASAGLAAILFDKDGTLLDFDATWGEAAAVVMRRMAGDDRHRLARLAEAMKFGIEERRFRRDSPMIAGSTADYAAAWAQHLGRPHDAALLAEIDAHFAREVLAWLTPIGAPAVIFARLRAAGLRLGLATNDAESAAREQSARLGLLDHLDFLAGYDSGFGAKPSPGMVVAFARRLGIEPERVALVGDSLHDLAAARAVGARAIAVLSGPADRDELEPAADHVLASIVELPALLESRYGVAIPAESALPPESALPGRVAP